MELKADHLGLATGESSVGVEMGVKMLWRAPWLVQRYKLICLMAWDILALYLSYSLTWMARFGSVIGISFRIWLLIGAWIGISYLVGRYSPNRSGEKNQYVARHIKTAVVAGSVLMLIVTHAWVYHQADAETRLRGFLIPLVAMGYVLSSLGQSIVDQANKKRYNWIILGSDEDRKALTYELEKEGKSLTRSTEIRSSSEIQEIVAEGSGVNRGIALGDIDLESKNLCDILLKMKEQGERVVSLLSWCELELQRIPPEMVDKRWFVEAEGFGIRPGSLSWRIKRFGDIAGAIALIALTAPITAICALLVYLEDRGPIFYSQVRSGLYGRPIRIWKLRSMRVNAESEGVQWASRSDPRVTAIGKLMRSTRIDELPQLVSVLKGDLSLIGPRPERPEIEDALEAKIPNYRIRHWVRPGLSGWAQVCYPYGASVEDSRMKLSYDLYYLRNANILIDLLITIKTIRLVSGAKGASPRIGDSKEAKG